VRQPTTFRRESPKGCVLMVWPFQTAGPHRSSPPDVADASCIFAVGCTLPAEAVRSGKVSDWNDVPDDQGYPAMRGATVRHVRVLLDQLDTARRNK